MTTSYARVRRPDSRPTDEWLHAEAGDDTRLDMLLQQTTMLRERLMTRFSGRWSHHMPRLYFTDYVTRRAHHPPQWPMVSQNASSVLHLCRAVTVAKDGAFPTISSIHPTLCACGPTDTPDLLTCCQLSGAGDVFTLNSETLGLSLDVRAWHPAWSPQTRQSGGKTTGDDACWAGPDRR